MLTREIVLTLPGHPAPCGSMKCVGERGKVKHQLVQDERVGQKEWRKAIVAAVRTHVRGRAEQYQPIGVEATFTIDRGKGHFGTGRNAGYLNAGAPQHPTKQNTNDADKMARLLNDALQEAELLVDDAQVVEVTARKAYIVATPEQLSGPKPPPWAEEYVPPPDALGYPGARIRIYPYDPDLTAALL